MNYEHSNLAIGIDVKREISKANLLIVFMLIMLPLMGCSIVLIYNTLYIHPRDYQIEVARDSARIYDKNVLLSVIHWGKDGIDSVILADNDKK